MSEIRSSQAVANGIAAGICSAGKGFSLNATPASPPYNDVPVQGACDRNYTDIAHLATLSAHWCAFFGEEIGKAAAALSSVDAQAAGS